MTRFGGGDKRGERSRCGRIAQNPEHLADLGLPLANDTLYGGEPVPGWGQRHALHASRLAGTAAATGIDFTVNAPLPADLRALLDG